MKKILRVVVIILVTIIVILSIPIIAFQTIKLATRPSEISLMESYELPLEEGQELCLAHWQDKYQWDLYFLIWEDGDIVFRLRSNRQTEIQNDFFIRHFQDLDRNYIIVIRDTGEVRYPGGSFPIVVVDEWYVLEKPDE